MKNSNSFSGFSLVEVTLALGIAAFTMIAIFGLMPLGMNATKAAGEQTVAVEIASAIATDLRTTPVTSGSSTFYHIPMDEVKTILYLTELKANVNNWTGITSGTSLSNDARYRVEIDLHRLPGAGRTATVGTIVVSWPPRPEPDKALGRYKTSIALDWN